MQTNGIPPFPPTGGYLAAHYTAFWEMAVPSVWSLAGLVIVHIFCGLENLTLQRAQAAQAALLRDQPPAAD